MTQEAEQPHGAPPEFDALPVLLVEDNPRLRALVVQTLESLGCTVESTADATAALRLLDEGRSVRLLLSDIRMPGPLDGIALARRVSEQYPEIAILLVTGFTHTVSIPFPVLSKPFGPEQLVDAMRGVLATPSAARSAPQLEASRRTCGKSSVAVVPTPGSDRTSSTPPD